MRKALRFILRHLSRWAIIKHKMKIVAVVGSNSTKLTGEILNQLISEKYSSRFEYDVPFWDFSIPLSILGVKDKRYSWFGWLMVLSKSILRLIFLKSNFTFTIVQLYTKYPEIIDYWMEIISPETTFLVKKDKDMGSVEKLIISKTQGEIYYFAESTNSMIVMNNKAKIQKDNSPLNVKFNQLDKKTEVSFNLKNRKYLFSFYIRTSIANIPMISCITYLINRGWTDSEIQRSLDLLEINLEPLWSSLL